MRINNSPEPVNRAGASFADQVLSDWAIALDTFFRAVERKAAAQGLSPAEISAAIARGYGEDVQACWDEWNAEGLTEGVA